MNDDNCKTELNSFYASIFLLLVAGWLQDPGSGKIHRFSLCVGKAGKSAGIYRRRAQVT